ncbi:MAG: hypothetical protein IKA57_00750, partial [Clostridia bacterium]|nr:hypothetical protein [Clostridia bacterium]
MKRMQSKALLLKKRVGTIHDRAKTAGMLYLLGIILMAAAGACLTLVTNTLVSGASITELPIINAYKAISELFANRVQYFNKGYPVLWLMMLIGVLLYIVMMFALIINIFRALAKLKWLFKRKASYTYGFNRNMYAMDKLGKIFSGSFALLILTNLAMILLLTVYENGKVNHAVTLFGYVVLGVGFIFHILCGLLEGRVTLFTMGDKIEEIERVQGLLVYFIRNLIQIAVVGVAIVFLLSSSIFSGMVFELGNVLRTGNIKWIIENVMLVTRFALEVLAWLSIAVMIRHAVGSTEYNREGKYGKGMRNFTVFSLLTLVFTAALLVLRFLGIGLIEGEKKGLDISLLIVAGACLIGFLSDCILKSRKKREDAETDENPQPMPPQFQGMPGMVPGMMPMFMPVYPYPFYGMPMQPANGYMMPYPYPYAPMTQQPESNVLEEVGEGPVEVNPPLDPNKIWMVRCPQCGKL